MMVVGGAGTGKSLVLVEGAKQEAAAGKSVLITFHSPELLKFFLPRTEGHGIDAVPFGNLPGDKTYDVVFIDEAQDLMTSNHMDRLDAIVLGGRSNGRWRMFLDPNNQSHVDGGFDQETYELVAEDAMTVDLDLNVRNTRAIVHVVQSYLGADIGDPGIVAGEPAEWHSFLDGSSLGAASALAKGLVDSGVKKTDIWIISASWDGKPFLTPEGVTVTTPRFAKGLEAEHVIVCDLPAELDETGLAALYVAVTRPRVALHMVVSKADKRRLESRAVKLLQVARNGALR